MLRISPPLQNVCSGHGDDPGWQRCPQSLILRAIREGRVLGWAPMLFPANFVRPLLGDFLRPPARSSVPDPPLQRAFW